MAFEAALLEENWRAILENRDARILLSRKKNERLAHFFKMSSGGGGGQASSGSSGSGNKGNIQKFVFGGLSGCGATLIVQPLDLIKTRLQLSGEGGSARVHRSTLHAIGNIVRQEGLVNLYNGLSAALFRQVTYTTTRMGVFQYLMDVGPSDPSFATRLLFGAASGAVAGVVGNPAEVALVRMTADGRLRPEERRNYAHVGDALYRVFRDEGMAGVMRGTMATVGRAVLLNAVQLGTYSQAKKALQSSSSPWLQGGMLQHITAGMISGLACTIVSLPVDMAKTRLQQMKPLPNGQMPYNGSVDCILSVVRKEGVLALWKGFTPYFLRLGPHTILAFIFLEQLNKRFAKGNKL